MRIKLDGNVRFVVKFEGFPLNSALFSVGEKMTLCTKYHPKKSENKNMARKLGQSFISLQESSLQDVVFFVWGSDSESCLQIHVLGIKTQHHATPHSFQTNLSILRIHQSTSLPPQNHFLSSNVSGTDG